MRFYTFILILFSSFYLINSCASTSGDLGKIDFNLNELSFDVVEKKITFKDDLPKSLSDPFNDWFNNKIKLTGFDGDVSIVISNYKENINDIPNGKKIEIFINFEIILSKAQNKKTIFSGEVKSFSEISGDFSLSDLDILIKKTHYNLVFELNNKLSNSV